MALDVALGLVGELSRQACMRGRKVYHLLLVCKGCITGYAVSFGLLAILALYKNKDFKQMQRPPKSLNYGIHLKSRSKDSCGR